MLLFLPVLTGLLLAASFPLGNQHYLAWAAFTPLIAFIFKTKSLLGAFWGGCISGGIQFFILLVWMPTVLTHYGGISGWLSWIGYVLLILLLSCFFGLACFITKLLMKRGGESFLLLFPAIWILVEYLQSKVPFGGFPWLLAGYSQSDWLLLIQIADLAGVFGASFLLLWSALSLFWIFLHRGRGFRAWWPAGVSIVLVSVCLLYGQVSLDRWEAIQPDFKVVMLQGNLSQDDPPAELREKYLSGYVQMVEALPPGNADLLILPESPTPSLFQRDPECRHVFLGLARRYTFGLIFNNIRTVEDAEGSRYYNSAFLLDHQGSISGSYDKMHLVPFGEYIPLRDTFSFMQTITKDVGEFHRGTDYTLLSLGGRAMNVTICFEAIFSDLVRKFVRDGSGLIVNLTNDGWYGSSSAPFQHFNIARWRAIENRRYFLRSANTGISAVVRPSGRVETATGILTRAVCEGRFGFVTQQTFYTRYGDILIFLCAIIVFGCTVFVYARVLSKSRPR